MQKPLLCRSCRTEAETDVLSLGALPVCNRFLPTPGDLPRFPLEVGACSTCGLVQLLDAAPVAAIRPEVDWIGYNEPEGHLDAVAAHFVGGSAQTAVGVGPFDGPLLSRLAASGIATRSLAPTLLPGDGRPAYLESYQDALRTERFAAIAAGEGTADIVVCRYLLEHSHQPASTLAALFQLVAPGGAVVVEVPDSSKFIAARDYCFLWEEHVVYFVEATLRRLATESGFVVERVLRYPGLLEDALVMVLRAAGTPEEAGEAAVGRTAFRLYAEGFETARARHRDDLQRVVAAGGQVALIGMGHQAIMFANAFALTELIAFTVDDDANKRGTIAPGFARPIISIAELDRQPGVALCLTAFNPRALPRILEKLPGTVSRGAVFNTIFSGAKAQSTVGDAA